MAADQNRPACVVSRGFLAHPVATSDPGVDGLGPLPGRGLEVGPAKRSLGGNQRERRGLERKTGVEGGESVDGVGFHGQYYGPSMADSQGPFSEKKKKNSRNPRSLIFSPVDFSERLACAIDAHKVG